MIFLKILFKMSNFFFIYWDWSNRFLFISSWHLIILITSRDCSRDSVAILFLYRCLRHDFIEKNVFKSVNKNDVSSDVRIFNFRFVNEIKHLDIDKAFEKSRFVMQTFNDQDRNLILIQSFIIQRINQRMIVCLIVVFSKMNLYLKNIIQTYVQSTTSLNRRFLCLLICSINQASWYWQKQHTQDNKIIV
jgi:hypothetical protein